MQGGRAHTGEVPSLERSGGQSCRARETSSQEGKLRQTGERWRRRQQEAAAGGEEDPSRRVGRVTALGQERWRGGQVTSSHEEETGEGKICLLQ